MTLCENGNIDVISDILSINNGDSIKRLLKLSENNDYQAISTINCIKNLLVNFRDNHRVGDFVKIFEKHGILTAIDQLIQNTENENLYRAYKEYKETLYYSLGNIFGDLHLNEINDKLEEFGKIRIYFKSEWNDSVANLETKKGTVFETIMSDYCDMAGFRRELTKFQFENETIDEEDTPLSIGLEHGDIITTSRARNYIY